MPPRKSEEPKYLSYRDLPSHLFNEQPVPAKFRDFCERQLIPRLKLTGYKQTTKSELAIVCIHNLVQTGMRGVVVGDSRDNGRVGVRLRIKVWDALVEAGLARVCKGSEYSAKQARYRATTKLLTPFKDWTLGELIDLNLKRNTKLRKPTDHALVVVRSGTKHPKTGKPLPAAKRKQPQPLPKTPPGLRRLLREREDAIERINRANLQHAWQAFNDEGRTFQPNVCLRQVHSGSVGRGARLYSFSSFNGQQLPKKLRRKILIDGEAVAELDFSGLATRALYHLGGMDPKGDVYRPRRVFPDFYKQAPSTRDAAKVRSFVKTATNVCWNVDSRRRAIGAVRKLLRDHQHYEFLSRLVFQVEETDPAGVVDRIVAVHPKLAPRFFSEVGIRLMSIDGAMMLDVLNCVVVQQNAPALGIHDSIVCRSSDVIVVRRAMINSYRRIFGFKPVITQVF
jgi:hypothetical protein